MKMQGLPFSYLLHYNAVRTKNIGGLERPASKFWPGALFASRRRWMKLWCARIFQYENVGEFGRKTTFQSVDKYL